MTFGTAEEEALVLSKIFPPYASETQGKKTIPSINQTTSTYHVSLQSSDTILTQMNAGDVVWMGFEVKIV